MVYINVDGHIYVCSALLFKNTCSNELYSYLYWSPYAVMKSREMRFAGHLARIAKNRTVYRIVVGTPEGKTPLGRLRLSMNTGWTVRGSNPGGGEIFRTRSDWPWGPRSLVYNGYRFFPGGKAAGAWR
jgi:hypothetical protein